jgi:sugar lactone lactonase YvrE
MKSILTLFVFFGFLFSNAQTYVYWGNHTTQSFYRSDTDGSNVVILATGQTLIRRVRVNERDQHVFWVEGAAGKLWRADLDGLNDTTILNVSNMLNLIFIDLVNDYIFFTETLDNKIQRCDLDGSNIQTVVTGVGNVQGLTIHGDNQELYWTEYDTGLIRKSNFAGTVISTVFNSGGHVLLDLDVNPSTGDLYYSDRTDNTIYMVDQSGVGPTLIANVTGDPGAVCLDLPNDKLYWIETTNGVISQSDYDGTNRVVVNNFSGETLGGLDIGHFVSTSTMETESKQNKIIAFPNPVRNLLTIDFSTPLLKTLDLVLYDVLGKKVIEKKAAVGQGQIQIDVSSLNEGCYYLKYSDSNSALPIIISSSN